MRRIKKYIAVMALMLAMLAALGCDERRDTRRYIHTIGVVFTLDTETTFQELFVFPGGYSEMGQDFLGNSRTNTKVGSFGVTVEAGDAFTVWLKDWDGGTYAFDGVPLANGDLATITFGDTLSLTLRHQSGRQDVVTGRYVQGGDAPDHPQSAMAQEKSFRFSLVNQTGRALRYISMREAPAPEKGDVELYLETLEADAAALIGGSLSGGDLELTEWLLHVADGAGNAWDSAMPFDPWTVSEIRVRFDADGRLVLETEKTQ